MSDENANTYSYETACKYRKINTYVAAILLVVTGIFSLIALGMGSTIRQLIITFYFAVIGVIIVMVELGKGSFP